MNNKKLVLGLATASIMMAALTAQAVPVINNGSLTGAISNNGVPTGWTAMSGSPDTMDENHNVGGSYGNFGATPSASADGGTWVGLGDDGSSFNEIFGQTVSGFDIGTTYAVSWYQANFGYTSSGYTNADSIAMLVDSVIVGTSSLSNMVAGWTLETVQFTATAANHFLSFGTGLNSGKSYMSMDGISVARTSSVPEPATLSLFGLGLLGLGLTRRRNKS